jgi:hypothetical protein
MLGVGAGGDACFQASTSREARARRKTDAPGQSVEEDVRKAVADQRLQPREALYRCVFVCVCLCVYVYVCVCVCVCV